MQAPKTKPVLVIAGPTASGKSGLALDAAEAFGGIIINADSMQVYAELSILTARPSAADEARAPHRLFGILPASEACSAARWQGLAVAEMEAAWRGDRLPILTGGTGFYIRAMIEGLSEIPPVPAEVRAEVQELRAEIGEAAFHARLADVDAAAGRRLPPGDRQRVLRAFEVYLATGRTLTDWHAGAPVTPVPGARYLTIVLDPPRQVLNAASDARFDAMMAAGALDEAAALKALHLDPALPAMKALGVPELMAHLAAELPLAEAIAAAKQATRQFAKRQQSWFRNQIEPEIRVDAQYSESLQQEIFPKIREFLLTAQN